MGEAGVCTSGCMLGLCQYVSGCLGLYQSESRHLAQAWAGRVFRRSQRVGQPRAVTEKQAFRQFGAAKGRRAKKV